MQIKYTLALDSKFGRIYYGEDDNDDSLVDITFRGEANKLSDKHKLLVLEAATDVLINLPENVN